MILVESATVFKKLLSFSLAVGVAGVMASVQDEKLSQEFDNEIVPILEQYCFGCHGVEKQKGDVDFSRFQSLEDALVDPDLWYTVLEVVRAHEMPPEGEPRPKYNERKFLESWLEELPEPELDCSQLASDRTVAFYRGYVMSRRLTKREYINTIRDLFGVESASAGNILPNDGAGGEGFDNNGSTLYSSSLAIEKYLEAANKILDTVFPESNSEADTRAIREQLARLSLEANYESLDRDAAADIVGSLARRAFRRPVDELERERLLSMFDRAWERGDGFLASLKFTLKAILVSPHFLFLSEPEPKEKGIQPLSALTLATRLSYFIWASTPDEELLRLAESGRILDEGEYREQIHRMLMDEKARALGERFAIQWLGLEHFGSETGPDPLRFPEFDAELANAMREEVIQFFNYIIAENRSVLELISSDYSFVNERLADLYDAPGVTGPSFQYLKFNTDRRGGLLGMAGVHAVNSYPLRTSPVLRGKWILEVLLGGTVNPPPPDVPALEEESEGIGAVSLREELEAHRKQSECAVCHNKMDPLGFSLENFDSLGRWRAWEKGNQIDASGTLPNGDTFEGPAGLKRVLMDQKDRVVRHFVQKMVGYALGRELNEFDDCVINDSMAALLSDGYRSWNLVETIALSLPFRNRYYSAIKPIEANEEDVANP